MTMKTTKKPRPALSKESVLHAALELAGLEGIESLSMRKLGKRLGVEAMSLYNHVANKDEILGGIVDLVVSEIELPEEGEDWKEGMRKRATSSREVFRRYPWALGLLESRSQKSPLAMDHYNRVFGCLRQAGFSVPMTAYTLTILDSYIYGFALQESSSPYSSSKEIIGKAKDILRQPNTHPYPYVAELITEYIMQPDYSYAKEFDLGLELILDGIERTKGKY